MEIFDLSACILIQFWDFFGTLGDWAGALATAAGVWWGIYQTKSMTVSKVHTTFDTLPSESGTLLRVFAINTGHTIIRFTSAGIRWVGSDEYLMSKVYIDPPKAPVEPNDNRVFVVRILNFQAECLKVGYSGIKEFIFDFTDTQHKTYSGRFKFNVDTMEVLSAKKIT